MCENYSAADNKINDRTSTFLKTLSDLDKDISEFKLKQVSLNNEVINKENLLKSENEIKSVKSVCLTYRKSICPS